MPPTAPPMRAPAAGTWRVALIDSCGIRPGASAAAAFVSGNARVACRPPVADPTGHGSRIAQLLAGGRPAFELLLGQVFLDSSPATSAAVAAALDWAVVREAHLIHLSLGLAADRTILRAAVERALHAGCILVASVPARGAAVYPASYPGVIQGTGDARCAPGELSALAERRFGGCPLFEAGRGPRSAESAAPQAGAADGRGGAVGRGAAAAGASIGAAWVTRAILDEPATASTAEVVGALRAHARYLGPERRIRAQP